MPRPPDTYNIAEIHALTGAAYATIKRWMPERGGVQDEHGYWYIPKVEIDKAIFAVGAHNVAQFFRTQRREGRADDVTLARMAAEHKAWLKEQKELHDQLDAKNADEYAVLVHTDATEWKVIVMLEKVQGLVGPDDFLYKRIDGLLAENLERLKKKYAGRPLPTESEFDAKRPAADDDDANPMVEP